MPRKNTLTHADFVRAERAKCRRERGSLFILAFGVLPDRKSREFKAACVVSKKIAARAVDRNLIKRRWRAAMLQYLSAVPAPLTFVFYATRPANNAPYADIKSDVAELVSRATTKLGYS